ncbi:MAG: glycosyltransferase family 2 protein [Cyclobacteriaceae bacterium]
MENQAVKISAVIITFNEEENIGRCISSLQDVADEIVVVDSFSEDRTREICESLGVRFMEHAFEGHIQQKNYATEQATHDFILSLDADEALSLELAEHILAVKKNKMHDAYRFNRLTNYCGKWIRHCGWYPDTKLRLWDRRKGKWGGRNPHDSVKMQAGSSVKHIGGDILHYSFHSAAQHLLQMDKFTTIMAREKFKEGKKVYSIYHLYFKPLYFFLHRYVVRLGFLDGVEGYIVCKNGAYYKFIQYVKLRELYKKKVNPQDLTEATVGR